MVGIGLVKKIYHQTIFMTYMINNLRIIYKDYTIFHFTYYRYSISKNLKVNIFKEKKVKNLFLNVKKILQQIMIMLLFFLIGNIIFFRHLKSDNDQSNISVKLFQMFIGVLFHLVAIMHIQILNIFLILKRINRVINFVFFRIILL